jgi:hypothetical protein
MTHPDRYLSLAAFGLLLFAAQPAVSQITVQQPVFGVAVDADGVLTAKTYTAPGGALRLKRLMAAKAALPGDVAKPSKFRKVSLVRLAEAVRRQSDAGQPLDASMKQLAGLQRLRYVFLFPDRRDIVIAGPAEGWVNEVSGRVVGITTGAPTLRLEDLAVALRAYPPQGPAAASVGCSIDPTAQGMARLREFQRTIPRRVSDRQRRQVAVRILRGTREALGMGTVRVFGIPPDTHAALVLLEADYRMKRIGIGLESTPVKMNTFIGSLKTARHSVFVRWWFTPRYDCLKVTEDALAMELVGQGVQLLGQQMVRGPNGGLKVAPGSKPGRASQLFTGDFTRKYPDIARRRPVFAELRNVIDLLVVAASLRRKNWYRRTGWDAKTFLDESVLPVRTWPTPRQVPTVSNALWKGRRLFVPSGGISIIPQLARQIGKEDSDTDPPLQERFAKVGRPPLPDHWWWD